MCEPVFSEEPFYTDGPVWSVQFIRTQPGATRSYFASLKAEWQVLMEEAKRQGLVLSYRIFLAPPANREDWDVMLTVEVRNMAVLDEFGHKMSALAARVRSAQTKQASHTNLTEVREILGMKLLREVTLK